MTPTPTHLSPLAARAITSGVMGLFDSLSFASLAEVQLPNRRRADVLALGPKGEIAIIEVKSSRADFLSDHKWKDYGPYCDRFYFAVSEAFPRDLLPEAAGLIIADRFGGAILRSPEETPLASARRKALTLKFGRLAASRLFALASSETIPAEVEGPE